MGIRHLPGLLVNFSSAEDSSTQVIGGSIPSSMTSLICTTLNNIQDSNDVWIVATVTWFGGTQELQDESTLAHFHIRRDFVSNTERGTGICEVFDTSVNISANTNALVTTTITCVDRDVPGGTHTYCLVSEQGGINITVRTREIVASEINV